MQGRFDEIDGRFDEIDGRFEKVEGRFVKVEGRLDNLEAEMRAGFEAVRGDIRHLTHKVELMTQDLMGVRADQRDLRVRVDALERKQS
jgi:archaellum component FlaC